MTDMSFQEAAQKISDKLGPHWVMKFISMSHYECYLVFLNSTTGHEDIIIKAYKYVSSRCGVEIKVRVPEVGVGISTDSYDTILEAEEHFGEQVKAAFKNSETHIRDALEANRHRNKAGLFQNRTSNIDFQMKNVKKMMSIYKDFYKTIRHVFQ